MTLLWTKYTPSWQRYSEKAVPPNRTMCPDTSQVSTKNGLRNATKSSRHQPDLRISEIPIWSNIWNELEQVQSIEAPTTNIQDPRDPLKHPGARHYRTPPKVLWLCLDMLHLFLQHRREPAHYEADGFNIVADCVFSIWTVVLTNPLALSNQFIELTMFCLFSRKKSNSEVVLDQKILLHDFLKRGYSS